MTGEFLTYLNDEIDSIKYPSGTRENPATNCKELYDADENKESGMFCNTQRS